MEKKRKAIAKGAPAASAEGGTMEKKRKAIANGAPAASAEGGTMEKKKKAIANGAPAASAEGGTQLAAATPKPRLKKQRLLEKKNMMARKWKKKRGPSKGSEGLGSETPEDPAAQNGGSEGGPEALRGEAAAGPSDRVAAGGANGSARSGSFRNKEKVLVLSSRGIGHRFRHLMMDLIGLLPHSKKDVKLESKETLRAVSEVADLKGCSSSIFFECRKKKDLYLWLGKVPEGPSAKFLVHAVHTMAELKLTGNHLKGARPILTFSPSFDQHPHLQLLKELFAQVFATPKEHRKSKPFFDHVFSFSFLDNHIWFRNYEITLPGREGPKLPRGALEQMGLVEVGPRFSLNPIKIFGGAFGGITIYENPLYVSPNVVRREAKQARSSKYSTKIKAKQKRKRHMEVNPMVEGELSSIWKKPSIEA